MKKLNTKQSALSRAAKSLGLRAHDILFNLMVKSGLVLTAAKWKTDAEGKLTLHTDGKPILIHEDGKEIPFDVEGTLARISALNAESEGHRRGKTEAEQKLKAFLDAGIEDPEVAKKALETVKNIDDKKLVDAGKVEEVRTAAVSAMQQQMDAYKNTTEGKLKELTEQLTTVTGQLHNELIGGGFSRSRLLNDDKHPLRLAIPADMARAYFGKHFKVEGGKIVAYYEDGNRIYSRERAGDPNVTFDEALEILVDRYPFKNQIVRGSNASGGGAGPTEIDGKMTIKRSEWEALPAEKKAAALKDKVMVD